MSDTENQAKEVSEEEQEVASVHSEDEGREYQHPEAGLKTSDFYHTKDIPERFNHPDWFEGYNTKVQHPFYATSACQYGSKSPSVHTLPTQFHGKSQKFSKNLGKFGMFRNHSLNTSLDRSKV